MLWSEACPGGELAGVAEFGEVGKLGDNDLGADFTKAGYGFEELAFGEELRVGLDEFGDFGTGGGELFLLAFDAPLDGGGDGFFGLGFEFGFESSGVLGEGVGVAAELGNALLVNAAGVPGEEFGVFGFEESGDEFGAAVSLLLRRSFCMPKALMRWGLTRWMPVGCSG